MLKGYSVILICILYERWNHKTINTVSLYFLKMQTRLRSRQHFPQLNRPISCNVTFEGPSVLEGIKNLGSQSFVDVPLPSYLANLHSLSKNSFFLTEKKTNGDSSLQHEDKLP